MGKRWKQWQTLFWGAPKGLQMVTATIKLKDACSLEEKLWQTQAAYLKGRDTTLPTKVCIVKAMVFSSSHVWMWELDYKESWAPKNWCFKTLESPLCCKEIKPVNTKGNQPWILISKTDADAEALILWPPDAKNWLVGKDPDAEKDWGQEEKPVTEDEKDSITNSMDTNLSKLWETVRAGKPEMLQSMELQRVRQGLATEKQQNFRGVCVCACD